MKKILKAVVLCGAFIISTGVFAETKNSALELLKKIIKSNKEVKGYTAVIETQQLLGGTTKMNISMRRDPKTKHVSMHFSSIDPNNKLDIILNEQGLWSIIGDTAIKMSYLSQAQIDVMTGKRNITLKDTKECMVKEGAVNGIKCFVITAVLSKKGVEEATKEAIELLPKNMKKMAVSGAFDISIFIPRKIIYMAGKQDLFIRQLATYSKTNVEIQKTIITNVKLGDLPSKKLFQLPKGIKKEEAKSVLDYSRILVAAKMKKQIRKNEEKVNSELEKELKTKIEKKLKCKTKDIKLESK